MQRDEEASPFAIPRLEAVGPKFRPLLHALACYPPGAAVEAWRLKIALKPFLEDNTMDHVVVRSGANVDYSRTLPPPISPSSRPTSRRRRRRAA